MSISGVSVNYQSIQLTYFKGHRSFTGDKEMTQEDLNFIEVLPGTGTLKLE
jgi:hypothetical protein